MSNLRLWEQLNKPPTTALKAIGAGRLKGKTDINPQWRLQAMTEAFGPVGFGWKYTIDRLWLETGAKEEMCAFALVSVYVKEGDTWSEPIPGIGGSMLIAKEFNGLYTSDEAFKMAVTDALSVSLKSLGVAAEIYLGNFDGSKYVRQEKQTKAQDQRPQGEQPKVEGESAAQKLINELGARCEWRTPAMDEMLKEFSEYQGKTLTLDRLTNADKEPADRLERLMKWAGATLGKLREAKKEICNECRKELDASGKCRNMSCPQSEPF